MDRMRLNARGIVFEMRLQDLKLIDSDRVRNLLNLVDNPEGAEVALDTCDHYDSTRREAFYDRDPDILNLMLDFGEHKRGHVHVDLNEVCVEQLDNELAEYWCIKDYESYLAPCCMLALEKQRERTHDMVKEREAILKEYYLAYDFGDCCFPKARSAVWKAIENPLSSIFAMIFATISCSMVVLAAIGIVLRSISDLNQINVDDLNSPYFIIEMVTVAWFTLEFAIKLVICPYKIRFILSLFTLIDLLSIVPFYIYLAYPDLLAIEIVKNISRIFRLFSLVQIFRKFSALNTVLMTLKNSYLEILVFIAYLSISMLFFSTILYQIEYNDGPDTWFDSIPATFWYTIVTMTTVGFGDMIPATVAGKIFGGICVIWGVVIIAMPVGLLGINFSSAYAFNKEKDRIFRQLEIKKGSQYF